MRIYMDNSATSFPKPDCVIKAMTDYMSNIGSSVSRSTSSQASATSDRLFELRELLADLFGAKDSRNVVFTKNITESLSLTVHKVRDCSRSIFDRYRSTDCALPDTKPYWVRAVPVG